MANSKSMQALKDALLKAACDHGRSAVELHNLAGLKQMSEGYAHYLLEELVGNVLLRHATDERSKRKARYRLTLAGLDHKSKLVIAETAEEVCDAD